MSVIAHCAKPCGCVAGMLLLLWRVGLSGACFEYQEMRQELVLLVSAVNHTDVQHCNVLRCLQGPCCAAF